MTLGEKIAELRKDHNMKQKDLAEILHVTIGTISNYETNTHIPDIHTLCKLAELFHVSTDYLLGRTSLEIELSKFEEPWDDATPLSSVMNMIIELNPEHRTHLLYYLKILYATNLITAHTPLRPPSSENKVDKSTSTP